MSAIKWGKDRISLSIFDPSILRVAPNNVDTGEPKINNVVNFVHIGHAALYVLREHDRIRVCIMIGGIMHFLLGRIIAVGHFKC